MRSVKDYLNAKEVTWSDEIGSRTWIFKYSTFIDGNSCELEEDNVLSHISKYG